MISTAIKTFLVLGITTVLAVNYGPFKAGATVLACAAILHIWGRCMKGYDQYRLYRHYPKKMERLD